MRTRAWFIAASLAATSVAPALAAQEPRLSPGTRVRVTPNRAKATPLIARMVAVRNDSLFVVSDSNRAAAYAAGDVARLETSGGLRRYTMRGAGIGFLAGAGLGAVIGAASYDPPKCQPDQLFCGLAHLDQSFSIAVTTALFAGVGTLTGALIGANKEGERWIPIGLPRAGEITTTLVPTRRGLAVTARIGF